MPKNHKKKSTNIQKQKNRQHRQKIRKVAKKSARSMARGFVKAQMSNVMGEPAANFVYSSVSRAVSSVPRSVRQKQLVLSHVASQYLRTFLTPFASGVKSTGLPRPPNQPTFKTTGYVRGVGAIGQAGVGYVAFAPCLANDKPTIYFSTKDYGQSQMSSPPSDMKLSASKAGAGFYPAWSAMTNLPYTGAQLSSSGLSNYNSDIDGRIVSASVSVQYTGTEVNRSGQYYAYADPDCETILGGNHLKTENGTGYGSSGMAQKDACEIRQAGRKGITVTAVPVANYIDDFTRANTSTWRKWFPYSNAEVYTTVDETSPNVPPATPVTYNTDDAGAPTLGVLITGIKEMTFYFEAIIHAEYVGPGVMQALLTETRSDVVGYDAVKCIVARAQRNMANNANLSFSQSLKQEMANEGVVFGMGSRSVDY